MSERGDSMAKYTISLSNRMCKQIEGESHEDALKMALPKFQMVETTDRACAEVEVKGLRVTKYYRHIKSHKPKNPETFEFKPCDEGWILCWKGKPVYRTTVVERIEDEIDAELFGEQVQSDIEDWCAVSNTLATIIWVMFGRLVLR